MLTCRNTKKRRINKCLFLLKKTKKNKKNFKNIKMKQKKQVEFPEMKVPNYELCYFSANQILDKSLQVGDFYFERIASANEHAQFRIEIGETTEDLELAERELALLQERVKSLAAKKNELAQQIRIDENGEKYIVLNDSKKGIWIKNGAYVELVTLDDYGNLAVVQRKDPQSFNIDLIAQAACVDETKALLEAWGYPAIIKNIQLEITDETPTEIVESKKAI